MLSSILQTSTLSLLRVHHFCLAGNVPSASFSIRSCTALFGRVLASGFSHWASLCVWREVLFGSLFAVAKLHLDFIWLGAGTWWCSGHHASDSFYLY